MTSTATHTPTPTTQHDHHQPQHDDAWAARAEAIAERDHLAATWLTPHPVASLDDYTAHERWSVPSRSGGHPHIVSYDGPRRWTCCDCWAAHYNQPCGHIGAVIAQVRATLAPILQAERDRESRVRYEKLCEWIEEQHPTRPRTT